MGRFWRYLLANFPETIDYLITVSEEQREHFNVFTEVLFEHFFDSRQEHEQQLSHVISDK